MTAPSQVPFRVGHGYDIHRVKQGGSLVLAGVTVATDISPVAHSDGDVVLHAVVDALLGAMGWGDIGEHFPNTDERWRNAESSEFLLYAVGLARERQFEVVNIDTTIDLEAPKLRPHIDAIRTGLAAALRTDTGHVSVKAKTGEGVDAVGGRLAIRAQAVVLLGPLAE